VRCDRFRDAASARLDGEPIGMSALALDQHLASCVDCARWIDEATRITRQARLGTVEVPDLADQILDEAVLPARRILRVRRWTRIALALVGIAQLGVAVPSLFGTSIDMAMSAHATHETAAWNVALAAAFLATAVRPRRAAGMLPALAVFVGVLAVLSVRDVAGGAVPAGRLATHTGIVLGLALTYLLARSERVQPPGREAALPEDEQHDDHGRGLRGVA
jgi:predicted anti-sigma-YlaC factor YlaD